MFIGNRCFAERADTDAGAADALIDPRVAGGLIDPRNSHVDILTLGNCKRLGWADLHAFIAKGAGALGGIDIRRVNLVAATPRMELDTARRANFATQAAADTGGCESDIIFKRTRWAQKQVPVSAPGRQFGMVG